MLLLDLLHKMVQRSLGSRRTGALCMRRCFLAHRVGSLSWTLHPSGSAVAVLGLTRPEVSSVRTSGEGFFLQNFLLFQCLFYKGQNLMVVALCSAASAQLFWPRLPKQQQQSGEEKARGPFAVHKELISSYRKPEVLCLVGVLL